MKVTRSTKQKTLIHTVLQHSENFINALELHEQLLKAKHHVSLATVYRTLHVMEEENSVDVIRIQGSKAQYRLCNITSHHHHLVCQGCARSIDIASPPLEKWAKKIATEHGYTQVNHMIELFGLCPACTQKTQQSTENKK